ncbi:uncharacterized protein LOC116249163 isoform X1 [Nymphaea colorata]|nr:uncharacterized protein LOC116249163 isoform X1 [Nymphaea colorata]
MRCQRFFGGKAVTFVSDLTTGLLNPISDEPLCRRRFQHEEATMKLEEDKVVPENGSGIQLNGPDTSSFTAFIYSLLSPSDSQDHYSSDEEESDGPSLKSKSKTNNIRRPFLPFKGRKKLLGGAVWQEMGRKADDYRNMKSDGHVKNGERNEQKLVECEMKMFQVSKDVVSDVALPDVSEPSLLLSETTRGILCPLLPALIHGTKWVLLYSTWRHGISLSTLYRRSALCPGSYLLVVGDRKGAVFGGLIEAPLRPTSRRKYQGTSNSFVFTDISRTPVVFRPTGANRYFTLCSPEFLALGGGGHFALYLDGDLLTGSSSASETFDNPCLAHTPEFEVKGVELWGFKYASKCGERETPFHPVEAASLCS